MMKKMNKTKLIYSIMETIEELSTEDLNNLKELADDLLKSQETSGDSSEKKAREWIEKHYSYLKFDEKGPNWLKNRSNYEEKNEK